MRDARPRRQPPGQQRDGTKHCRRASIVSSRGRLSIETGCSGRSTPSWKTGSGSYARARRMVKRCCGRGSMPITIVRRGRFGDVGSAAEPVGALGGVLSTKLASPGSAFRCRKSDVRYGMRRRLRGVYGLRPALEVLRRSTRRNRPRRCGLRTTPATASTGYAPERRSKLVAELSDVVVPACF